MINNIKDYIGWWMLIPAVLIILLQVPGCVQQTNIENTKQLKIMTAHCASQGKTYMEYPDRSQGVCS